MIQLHLRKDKKELNAQKISPIINRPHFVKARGGLWTSSYNQTYGSEWVRAYDHMFGYPDEGQNGWLLIPQEDARICTIASYEDLETILQQYELKTELDFFRILDYELLSKDYDALHLTTKGERETRYSHPISLYGWDCESTHWFRWCFQEVKYLGKIKKFNFGE